MNKLFSLTVMGALIAVGIGAISSVAQAQSEATTVLTFNINEGHSCPAGAQMCNVASPHQFTLERAGEVFFKYDVAQPTATSAHCSSIEVEAHVNGNKRGITPQMGWPAYTQNGVSYPGDPSGRPLSSGYISLGNFSAGVHTAATRQIGIFGGCNFGYLLGGSGMTEWIVKYVAATINDKPQCSDAKDNDGDGKIDYPADLGCESPNDNDEKDKPQCSDGRDNDGDGKVDSADPGCHTDGDPNDGDDTYNPNDNDERDQKKPQCSDNKDNDDDGLEDADDPGCHTDHDLNKKYNPDDDDEHNAKKVVKAAVIKVAQITPVAVTAKTGVGSLALIITLAGAAGLGVTRKFLA